jgi:hypothetical protein
MPSDYLMAWWNVENLFDIEGSPRRPDKVKRAIGNSIIGWTQALLDRKVAQLASVIVQMKGGAGPDLIGFCEVENEFVLKLLQDAMNAALPNRTYDHVHADTSDDRGIDVCFIYDTAFFSVPLPLKDSVFQHVVMRRTATREIMQVNFLTHKLRKWSLFANHWPSRSGGQFESAGYRAIAGETLSYFHQRAIEVHGNETPAMAMGDFNDEPFDLSLVQYALSTRQRNKVVNGDSPRFWNLTWARAGAVEGTFYFDNMPNVLDQILVNKNMAQANSPIRALADSLSIFRLPGMVRAGDYPAPIPYGGMGKPVNQNGFSDHFPITIGVTEAD